MDMRQSRKAFLSRRGNSRTRSRAIGVNEVRKWTKTLPRGSSAIDRAARMNSRSLANNYPSSNR